MIPSLAKKVSLVVIQQVCTTFFDIPIEFNFHWRSHVLFSVAEVIYPDIHLSIG